MSETLFKKNKQYYALFELIDGLTEKLPDGVTKNPNPTYINNATGTMQVLDPTNTPLVIGPANATTVNATYVAGTNGNYLFLITEVFDPPVGAGYKLIVDLTAAGGFVYHEEPPAVVEIKKKP
jgi:hypothetical protein